MDIWRVKLRVADLLTWDKEDKYNKYILKLLGLD